MALFVRASVCSLTGRVRGAYSQCVGRCNVIVLVLVLLVAPARGQKPDRRAAAVHFKKGEAQYNKGEFTRAIAEFTRAHELSPHPTCLFNIARSHENLGNYPQALDFYRQALALTAAPVDRIDIERRIRNIESRPVKVFVSSRPPGAAVSVDGRREPEPGLTPLVLKLAPGEHLLVFRLAGHHLATRRVEVEMEKELPVEAKLEALPGPCPPPPPPCPDCPAPRPCPRLELADLGRLGLHFSLMGAFYISPNRPFAGGPGVQIHATWRRIVMGAQLTGFPVGEEQQDITIHSSDPDSRDTFNKVLYQSLIAQLEGGYSFPFRTSYIYTTLGLGAFIDQITYSKGKTTRSVPARAFTWSVGGGLEAMVTRWLSVGVALRVGAIHGERANEEAADEGTPDPVTLIPVVEEDNLVKSDAIQPYMVLWGGVSLHL